MCMHQCVRACACKGVAVVTSDMGAVAVAVDGSSTSSNSVEAPHCPSPELLVRQQDAGVRDVHARARASAVHVERVVPAKTKHTAYASQSSRTQRTAQRNADISTQQQRSCVAEQQKAWGRGGAAWVLTAAGSSGRCGPNPTATATTTAAGAPRRSDAGTGWARHQPTLCGWWCCRQRRYACEEGPP